MWPRKKARANRKYRRQVGQVFARKEGQNEREEWEERDARSLSIRRDTVRKWGPPMSMREWVTSHLDNRIRRTAWNYFKQPYDQARHRERFISFLKEITEEHSAYSRHLARYLNEVMEPPEPVLPGGRGLWLYPQAYAWLSAFFSDEPEWETHLRQWIRGLLL